MGQLSRYRTALYLSIAIALTNFVGWGAVVARSPQTTKSAIMICALPFVISFGIWVQSIFVSSIGAIWMIFWGAALIWPVVSSPPTFVILAVFFVICGVLNWLTAGIMLTKQFRTEFNFERKHQLKYKTYLRWSVFSAIIGAMIVMTFVDVVNLASIQ